MNKLLVFVASMFPAASAFADQPLGTCDVSVSGEIALLEKVQGYPSEGDFFRISFENEVGSTHLNFQLNKSKKSENENFFSIADSKSSFKLDKVTEEAVYSYKAVEWECWPGLNEWCLSRVPKWKSETTTFSNCKFDGLKN